VFYTARHSKCEILGTDNLVPGMSKNMGNSQPIGYIFTHSWGKKGKAKRPKT